MFASSSSIYGPTSRASRERDRPAPIPPYGVTKLAAEHLCLAHVAGAGTPLAVTVPRYFTVYGPRQRPGMAISRVLLAAVTGVGMPLYGDGRQRREFTYVYDAVTATVSAADPDIAGAVINIGGGPVLRRASAGVRKQDRLPVGCSAPGA